MQMLRSLYLIPLLALSLSALAKTGTGADAPEVRMYRYTNNQGTVVTSSKIPPEYAKKGYKIVSMNGAVLEEVAPELPEAQRKLMSQDQLSKVEQAEKDKQLMLRYANPGELMQARDRKLAELTNKISSEESNLIAVRNQTELHQEKAANAERSGKEVPAYLLKKLNELYHDQEIAGEKIAKLKAELEHDTAQYANDIERYEFISNQRLKKQSQPDSKPQKN